MNFLGDSNFINILHNVVKIATVKPHPAQNVMSANFLTVLVS
jgi:hypothetical protein